MTAVSFNSPNQRTSFATYATSTVLGGIAAAGLATAVGAITRTPLRTLMPRLAMASAAGAGAALLVDHQLGGSIGAMTWGQRNQLWFAARHVNTPGAFTLARHTYADATAQQASRYGTGKQIDNGKDAERHAWASAALAVRLVHREGFDVDRARAFTLGLGDAHERDGIDNSSHSSEMDRHNNATGAAIGFALSEQLGREPNSAELLNGIREAIAAGRMLVIDDGVLRASTPDDLGTPSP